MSNMHDLHALADGQLNETEKAQVLERLKSCPVSQAEYQSILQVKDVLAGQCTEVANEEGWKACRARLDELDRAKKVNGFVGKYAWGLAASVGLVLVSAHITNRLTGKYYISSGEATASVMGSREQAPSMDAEGRAIVGNRVINVPKGVFTLKSVRQGYLDSRPTSCLRLQYGSYPLELYVVEGGAFEESGFTTEPNRNGTAVRWSDGSAGFILVGSQSEKELLGLAEKLSTSIRR